MRFLRGRRGDERPSDDAGVAGDDETARPPDPDETRRTADSVEAFEAGLSELARRQLRFEHYARADSARAERATTWLLTERTDVRTPDGEELVLDARTPLEHVETRTERLESGMGGPPVAIRVFVFRDPSGRLVELSEESTGPAWPTVLERVGGDGDDG